MAAQARTDGRIALAIVAFATLALIATPLLVSMARAVLAPAGIDQWPLWWPSVSLAAVAASIALLLAMIGHWASERGRISALTWSVVAVTAACAMPSYVHALTWSWLLPPAVLAHGRAVAMFVLGLSYAPVTFLVLVVTWKPAPRGLSEAAWMAGLTPLEGRLLLARRAIPSLFAAWLIAFLLAFSDFPVADYFRVTTYATEVFARVAAWMDPAAAGRLALPVLATGVVLIAALTGFFRQLEATVLPGTEPSRQSGRPASAVGRSAAGLAFFAAIAGIPLAALAMRLPDAGTLAAAFRTLASELPGTVGLGLATGAVAALLGGALAYLDTRRVVKGARFARTTVWAALAWPASLVCLGAIALFASPALRPIQAEWTPMFIVLVLRWLVLAYEVWWSFWVRMPAAVEESAWLVGMPWWQALARLLWARGGPALGASVLLVACFSINDLTVFVLLAPPGFSTTTLNIFSAVHYGPTGYLAALCLWQVTFVMAMAALAVMLLRRATPAIHSTMELARAAG